MGGRQEGSSWRRFLEGLLGLGTLRVADAVLGFLVAALLARSLGAAGLGVYSSILAVVNLAGVPGQAGVPTVVMREVARAESRGSLEEMRGVMTFGLVLSLCASGGLAVCIWSVGMFVREVPREFAGALVAGSPLVVLFAMVETLNGFLCGLGRSFNGYLPETVVRPGLYVVLLSLDSWVSGVDPSPARALQLLTLAAVGALAAALLLASIRSPAGLLRCRPDFTPLRSWCGSSVRHAVSQALRVLQPEGLVLLLSYLAPSEAVGQYRIAQRGAGLGSLLSATVTVVVAPELARLHALQAREAVEGVLRRSALLMTVPALGFLVLVTLQGPWLLGRLFGGDFVPAHVALVVLSAAQVVTVLPGPLTTLLLMTRHDGAAALGLALSALIAGVVTLSLVSLAPVESAAVGQLMGTVVVTAAFWVYARSRIGLRIGLAGL